MAHMSHVVRNIFEYAKKQRQRSAAHSCRLISTIVVCNFNYYTPQLSKILTFIFNLASVADQSRLDSVLHGEKPQTGFLTTRLILQQ